MKTLLLLLLTTTTFLTSCTTDTDELRSKLKRKNEAYLDRQERWKMRKEARQERVDAWYDRMLH